MSDKNLDDSTQYKKAGTKIIVATPFTRGKIIEDKILVLYPDKIVEIPLRIYEESILEIERGISIYCDFNTQEEAFDCISHLSLKMDRFKRPILFRDKWYIYSPSIYKGYPMASLLNLYIYLDNMHPSVIDKANNLLNKLRNNE